MSRSPHGARSTANSHVRPIDDGLRVSDARRHLWFVVVKGLVTKVRTDLMPHNLPYAHDHEPLDFAGAIEAVKPHVLIGATGAPGTFTQEVVERMSALNARPVLFALSNPTSRAECLDGLPHTRPCSRFIARGQMAIRREGRGRADARPDEPEGRHDHDHDDRRNRDRGVRRDPRGHARRSIHGDLLAFIKVCADASPTTG